jgi:hypothetical protein
MGRQVVEIVDELVEVAMKTCCESFWLHVDDELTKIAHTICDAKPRAENECRALRGHSIGELERCHQVRWWIFDVHPYLACQLSVFYPAYRGVCPRW